MLTRISMGTIIIIMHVGTIIKMRRIGMRTGIGTIILMRIRLRHKEQA